MSQSFSNRFQPRALLTTLPHLPLPLLICYLILAAAGFPSAAARHAFFSALFSSRQVLALYLLSWVVPLFAEVGCFFLFRSFRIYPFVCPPLWAAVCSWSFQPEIPLPALSAVFYLVAADVEVIRLWDSDRLERMRPYRWLILFFRALPFLVSLRLAALFF